MRYTDEAPPAFERLRERVEFRTGTCGELIGHSESDGTYHRVAPTTGDNIIGLASPTSDGG